MGDDENIAWKLELLWYGINGVVPWTWDMNATLIT